MKKESSKSIHTYWTFSFYLIGKTELLCTQKAILQIRNTNMTVILKIYCKNVIFIPYLK